jgi:RNA polymerase sigma-70 factor (ECF subfamily)
VTAGGGAATEAGTGRPDAALASWMEAHGPELRAHLARMLERPDDAEDVLQQVWVTAHRSPPADGPGANVRAWLYRVATNAALDRLARERRRARLLAARSHELSDPPSRPPPPDEGLAEADGEEIRRRVSALPRKQREAVWLRWIEGEPYDSMAEKLECTPAAARANVYQGLKRLRRELAPFWNEETER